MFDARVWRRAPRPIPVLVDPHAGLRMGFTRYDGVPMWLRASGFRIDPPHPGQALEWLRLDNGTYLIRVRFRLHHMGGGEGLEIVTWLPAAAVAPRPDGWRPPPTWIEARTRSEPRDHPGS